MTCGWKALPSLRGIYGAQYEFFCMWCHCSKNIETEDYRYFIPDRNETLFPKPTLIGSLEDVDKKMRGRFNNINLFEHFMRQRPNSK